MVDMCNSEFHSDTIKCGSFSLGDVMNHEIRKFGSFAFRDKRTSGDASKRFVEEFMKSAPPLGRTERGLEPEDFVREGGRPNRLPRKINKGSPVRPNRPN
jgi:hypothetical protein